MVKRLVELDNETGDMKEVDPKRVRRTALAVRDYILNASPDEEAKYNYRKHILPWVDQILAESLPLPFDIFAKLHYLSRMISDDMYPQFEHEFRQLLAEFKLAVSGSRNSDDIVEKDGKRWVWEAFED